MRFINIRVYEHDKVPIGEAWLVRQADSCEVPTELRGQIRVPCILTQDAARLGRDLTLSQIAEAYEASGRGPLPPLPPQAGTDGGVRCA